MVKVLKKKNLLIHVQRFQIFGNYSVKNVLCFESKQEEQTYLQELIFRSSYRDSYVPRRVSAQVERF